MSKLTKAQEEYFKDSVVRNKDDSLKIVYHGTPRENFTAFRGSAFFTDDKETAKYFAKDNKNRDVCDGIIFECYINCKNPLIFDAEGKRYNYLKAPYYVIDDFVAKNREDLCYELDLSSCEEIDDYDYNELEEDLIELYNSCFYSYYEGTEITIEQLQSYAEDNGYDGLIVNNVRDLNDNIPRTQYITFEPNQIKSINNLYPTKDDNFINNEENYFKNSSLEDKLEAAEKKAALHNKGIENKTKDDLSL